MRKPLASILFFSLAVLYALHQDLWLWNDPRPLLGLPVGLTYHVLYCLAAAALLGLIVRFAWPPGLDEDKLENGG